MSSKNNQVVLRRRFLFRNSSIGKALRLVSMMEFDYVQDTETSISVLLKDREKFSTLLAQQGIKFTSENANNNRRVLSLCE